MRNAPLPPKQADSDSDKIAVEPTTSPRMTRAAPSNTSWASPYPQQPHPPQLQYQYYGQVPYDLASNSNGGAYPHAWVPAYVLSHPQFQSPQNQQQFNHPVPSNYDALPSDYQNLGPDGMRSPAFGPPGSVWPQHSYDMYQQQVPIAPQHTGQSQPGYGTPQYPMVAHLAQTKSDLVGVRGTPPLNPESTTNQERQIGSAQPAELNNEEGQSNSEPYELPHDSIPRRNSRQDEQ